jgi:hypothetical protein
VRRAKRDLEKKWPAAAVAVRANVLPGNASYLTTREKADADQAGRSWNCNSARFRLRSTDGGVTMELIGYPHCLRLGKKNHLAEV